MGNNVAYDARSHQLDVRPESVISRRGLLEYVEPIPLGIDEDPPGDTTGQRQFGRRMNGDGFPGLRGVDDNFDFLTDPMGPDGTLPADDDEDFRVDEDPLDQRRDGLFFHQG